MKTLPENLRHHPDIWQASQLRGQVRGAQILPTGHELLDKHLHLGGWPGEALSEVLVQRTGIGEFQLVVPALLGNNTDHRSLFLVAPPYIPFAPALHQAGVRLEQLVIIKAISLQEQLWSIDQILRSGSSRAILSWFPQQQPAYADLRRMQLGARNHASAVIVFRPIQYAQERSPAAMRMQLEHHNDHLTATIIKQRGGWSGQRLDLHTNTSSGWQSVPASMLPTVTRQPKPKPRPGYHKLPPPEQAPPLLIEPRH